MTKKLQLAFKGLRFGSPQRLGAVRLVPLLRDDVPGDLRIGVRAYGDAPAVVSLDGSISDPGVKYWSYVPHGLVVSYSKDGAEAAFGTTLGTKGGLRERKVPRGGGTSTCARVLHRMVKGEPPGDPAQGRFRMLPLHLAMEGYLAFHFGGPDVMWSEYSRDALRFGLDPRYERSVRGAWLPGFEEALRVFERHESQVGVLVFVADALAAASIVSHPLDYARLHRSLVEDFFGELVLQHALLYPDVPPLETKLDAARVSDLPSLRREVERARHDWEESASLLVDGLLRRAVDVEIVRTAAPFRLERFLPEFDPDEECHIGERIVRDDGTLEYMKTFRLSAAQVRRAHLLGRLADAGWSLERCAARLACSRDELVLRLSRAGFGYLLKPHVLQSAFTSAARG